jgi:hypothetical protein
MVTFPVAVAFPLPISQIPPELRVTELPKPNPPLVVLAVPAIVTVPDAFKNPLEVERYPPDMTFTEEPSVEVAMSK